MGMGKDPYTVDKNKEKTAYKDYDELNLIVRNIFFNKNSNENPVYMDWADVENSTVKEASGNKYSTRHELINALAAQIKKTITTITSKKNSFKLHNARCESWKTPLKDYDDEPKYWKEYWGESFYSPKIDFPPIIALLALFSYAAEIMRSDDDINATNYYKRLADLLQINDELGIDSLGTSYRKYASIFWEDLNIWLEKNDGVYGIPTARPVFKHWKYISYAISQSLLRDADRKNLRKMFENNSLNIDVSTPLHSCIKRYLNFWMTTSEPSQWNKRLWARNDPALREKICESTLFEFKEWKINEGENPNKKINRNSNMSWVFSYNNNYGHEEINFLMTSHKIANNEEELGFKSKSDRVIIKDGEKIFLEPIYDYDFSFLSPRENIHIHQLFHKPFTLTIGEYFISHKAFPIIVFIKEERTQMYHEVIPSAFASCTTLFREHAVTCHKDQYKEVKLFLEKYCELGLIEVDKKAKGKIDDWHIFINVIFTRLISAEDINDNLKLLVPIEEGKEIFCEGGLRLMRNIWHSKNPPNIYSFRDKEDSRIIFEKSESKEMVLENPEDLKKHTDYIDNNSIKFSYSDDRKNSMTKEISFRTANYPRKLPTNKNEFIGYTKSSNSLFSGNKIKDKNSLYYQGFLASGNEEKVNINAIAKYKDYKINANFENESNNENYSLEKKNLDEDSCIVRGCHIWIVPPQHLKLVEEYEGKLDIMKCSSCDLEHPMPNRKKRKKKQKEKKYIKENIIFKSQSILTQDKNGMDVKKISTNDSFDGLCYLGNGNYELLKKVVTASCNNFSDARFVIENLINLGHIDVLRDDNNVIKEWSVSPTIINLKENEMFLSGYRSDDLVKKLDNIFNKENFSLRVNTQERSPEKIYWSLDNSKINKIEIESKIENLNNNREEKINVQENTAIKILQGLNEFSEYFKKYKKREAILDSDYEKFNVNNGRWYKSKLDAQGAYRIKGNVTQYYFYNGTELIYAQHDIVKTKAAVAANKVIHEYHSEGNIFKCFLSTEPPGIYKRALMAESGEIATIENNHKVFKNISEKTALLLMSKLYN